MTDSTDNARGPDEAYDKFYTSRLENWSGHLILNTTTKSAFHAGWQARADLAHDPLDDPRVKELETKLARAVEALERVMVGGNHLAIWLPDNHPTAEAEPLAALEQIGAGVSYDVWCCWRSIMQARTALAELKGQDDE